MSGSIPFFQTLNIPATPRKIVNHLKKKRGKEKNSYYTVTEMLKGQTVHQSISLYPTIFSSVQLFLGPL